MKETGICSRESWPCTIASVEASGWDAPNASMIKKDDRHVYIYDPDGNLPEMCGVSLMAIKNKQRTFMYSIEAEESFDCGDGAVSVCRVLSAEPAALKFLSRVRDTELIAGDVRDLFRAGMETSLEL